LRSLVAISYQPAIREAADVSYRLEYGVIAAIEGGEHLAPALLVDAASLGSAE